MKEKNRQSILGYLLRELRRIIYIMVDEYRFVFRDSGLVAIFLLATIVYPLLYSSIYKNETVYDMPIAVVDKSNSVQSRKLIQRIDATPDLEVIERCNNLEEIKDPYYRRNIHGAIYIPKDFNSKINRNEQAHISIYSDMSSFLYYRSMLLGTNMTVLNMNKDIKKKKLNAMGKVGQEVETSINPYQYKGTILYNKSMGFSSFLLPALLILIIHQTLFFGITMGAGIVREGRNVLQSKHPTVFYPMLLGKSLCYFSLYIVIVPYVLLFIPYLFDLPHIGDPMTVMRLMIPFLFAVIFFSMAVSVFIKTRETGIIVLLFTTVVLLFLSGVSWPQSNIRWFWKTFSLLFPSTLGIQGYLKIHSMGATIQQVAFETTGLWIQAIVYFIIATISYRFQWKYDAKKEREKLR